MKLPNKVKQSTLATATASTLLLIQAQYVFTADAGQIQSKLTQATNTVKSVLTALVVLVEICLSELLLISCNILAQFITAPTFIPSMSRKRDCLGNTPIASFFNLLKRESLSQQHIKNIAELSVIVDKYVRWFNHGRISLKTKGLPPIAYRKQVLGN